MGWFVEEAHSYEGKPGIENGATNLHRQMDAQDLIFAERETLSARAVAASPGKSLPEDADSNSTESRIHRVNRQACDEIEGHCRRIFPNSAGKDADYST
jgi:hypothetical protein